MFHGALLANGHTRRSRDAAGDDVAAMVVVVVGRVVVVVLVVVVLVVVVVVVVAAVRHRFALQRVDVATAPAFTEVASTAGEPDPDFELALGTLQAEASTPIPKTIRANRGAFRHRSARDRETRCWGMTRAIGASHYRP
jgi:hypothetical protein